MICRMSGTSEMPCNLPDPGLAWYEVQEGFDYKSSTTSYTRKACGRVSNFQPSPGRNIKATDTCFAFRRSSGTLF
ncbi:unnamed protein product [Caenorhabditis auriculariae]|uniref:Uncharacterized protein n=1 Tax=Caenorhabditis auriculariae TaxID=2777116 RepID=A0A8S1HTH1_9PELO|nr:unnamed protein product [Caenorhabditis auriculariae]